MFALRGEEWRISAYLLLQQSREGRPWSDTLEKAVVLLLGYSEEQANVWIQKLNEKRCAWGALTAYMFLDDADIVLLQKLGLGRCILTWTAR